MADYIEETVTISQDMKVPKHLLSDDKQTYIDLVESLPVFECKKPYEFLGDKTGNLCIHLNILTDVKIIIYFKEHNFSHVSYINKDDKAIGGYNEVISRGKEAPKLLKEILAKYKSQILIIQALAFKRGDE